MRWAHRITALDQHHVGSHRADHGPKHEPGVTSNQGQSKPDIAEGMLWGYLTHRRHDSAAAVFNFCLTETAPLPKS